MKPLVAWSFFLIVNLVAAAERQPLGISDLLSMRRIISTAISSDGAQVAFAVEEPNDGRHSRDPIRTTLWTWSKETGKVVSHPAPVARNHTPKWSPDGTRLAFLSSLPGESSRLWIGQHSVLSGVTGYAWSPD